MTVLSVAIGELGYVETPNNITKYWAELDPGLQGQPWCAAFVSWSYLHAGTPLPPIGRPYGFVYVPAMISWAKANGHVVGDPQPGDVVCYGGGVHTGIFEKWLAPGAFSAIEGNTSPDSGGSQSNGGGVYRKTRSTGWVTCFVHPVTAAPPNLPADPPAGRVPTSPVITHGTLGGKPVAVQIEAIETDANGDGSIPAPPGFLAVMPAGAHDKYDPNTHDADSLVLAVGARASGGGWRLVVAHGPASTIVGAPVLVSD